MKERIIKFRAWDKNRKEMFFPKNIVNPTQTQINDVEGGNYRDEDFKLNHYQLMQFTGLKDKNGKEIYEGDIVNYHNGTTTYSPEYPKGKENWPNKEIVFVDGIFSIKDSHPLSTVIKYHKGSQVKIIGNIYENENLLK